MNNRLYLHLMANKEKGFALPLAVLIGLILMVTGMTMMMRAQGDQSKVIAQKARADAFRSSEVGLARVQDLLNSVRVMATVGSKCTSGDNCWEKAEVVTNPSTDLQRHLRKLVDAATPAPSCSNPNDAATLTAKIDELRGLSANKWSELGNNRYYRVVGYDYSIGTGRGVLTLEGLSRTSAATDLTKTDLNRDSDDNAASRNRVVVTIPILDSPPLAFNRTTVPALWISDGTVEDVAKFEGDVVEKVASPCNNKQDKIKKPTTDAPSPPYTAQFVGVFFPNLPPIPGSIPNLGGLTTSETFPRTGDTPTPRTINGKDVDVYEYIVDNINLSGSDKITITPGNRVVFYVKGNIKGAIEHDCGTTTGCKSGNLQIYANGSGSICLTGNQKLQAFIFAPDYSLGKTDDGTFIGAAWGKNWGKITDCPSSSVAVAVTQTKGVEWTELIQDLKPKFPELDQIANWCEEPIDTAAGKSECNFPTASPSPSP
ncbi:MAG: hypothetical protein GPJ22_08330 [Microcystis aeruginosa LL13-03]|nr:hypothetical protein [Microcystis aeruginosa SX13-11]NCR17325.1 hypothetical protein [Microcystis aeruginosa LL13-03]NCR67105.1 hypothetical protein [Microcystis aeruginosa LL11-07]